MFILLVGNFLNNNWLIDVAMHGLSKLLLRIGGLYEVSVDWNSHPHSNVFQTTPWKHSSISRNVGSCWWGGSGGSLKSFFQLFSSEISASRSPPLLLLCWIWSRMLVDSSDSADGTSRVLPNSLQTFSRRFDFIGLFIIENEWISGLSTHKRRTLADLWPIHYTTKKY